MCLFCVPFQVKQSMLCKSLQYIRFVVIPSHCFYFLVLDVSKCSETIHARWSMRSLAHMKCLFSQVQNDGWGVLQYCMGLRKYRKIEKTMSNHSLYWVVIQVRYDPYYAYRLKLGVGWIGIQIDNDFLHWRAFCFISTNCCRNIKSIWYDFKYGTNGSSVSMWLNFHYFSYKYRLYRYFNVDTKIKIQISFAYYIVIFSQ